MCKKIFKNESYSIYYHTSNNRRKDIIGICFDDIRGGFKKSGFGVGFFKSINTDVIFVSHKEKSFFQGLLDTDLYNHISAYIKNRKVFTFGFSLGAYASLYYAPILNAQAIAISPRCSIDPIYVQNKYKVKFRHGYLSDRDLTQVKKPIIFIDLNEHMDYLFFKKRIVPAFHKNIHRINFLNAGHHIPRVMVDLGVLKKTIKHIVEFESPPMISFDFTESVYCLGRIARKEAEVGNYESANLYLESILDIDNNLNSRALTGVNSRLIAYSILLEKERLTHVFNRKHITKLEKISVIKECLSKAKYLKSTQDFLLNQFNMYTLLMDFDSSLNLAKRLNVVFPDSDIYKDLLLLAYKNIETSKELIV